jgi:hypothetical protein
MVLGNPANGSAYLYSLTGIEVVFPHMTGRWDSPRRALLTALRPDRLGIADGSGQFDRSGGIAQPHQARRAQSACLPDLGLPVKYLYVDQVSYRRFDLGDLDKLRLYLDTAQPIDSGGGAAVYELPVCRR